MVLEILDNKYVSTVLILIVTLYCTFIGPELPQVVKKLFTNTIFRILVLFLVVVKGNTSPSLAIIIAIAFVLTLDYIYLMEAKEAFAEVSCPTGQVLNKDGICVAVVKSNTKAVPTKAAIAVSQKIKKDKNNIKKNLKDDQTAQPSMSAQPSMNGQVVKNINHEDDVSHMSCACVRVDKRTGEKTQMTSAPAGPLMTSAPAGPLMTSAPAGPLMTSAPAGPLTIPVPSNSPLANLTAGIQNVVARLPTLSPQ